MSASRIDSHEGVVAPSERDLTDAKVEVPPVHQDDSICDYSRADDETSRD